MFDGLLKSKFYSKCKTAIKLTKTRIEMIRRKRNAMQKYLRNDIAVLLRDGLDINAYGRAEGLLVELNMSACYDFIEQFCGLISNNVSLMNKQRECPEECKEAVSSLMFAAARFADMPELRELRSVFADRYGNSIEANVNKEFVEKLKATPPRKDVKLQLLLEIALESDLQWDSKALEQKLYNPPPSEQTRSKDKSVEKYNEEPVRKTDKQVSKNKQQNVRDSAPKGNKEDFPSYGRKEVGDGIGGGSIDRNDRQTSSNSESNVAEGTTDDDNKAFFNRFTPPPYTKPITGETEKASSEATSGDRLEVNHHRDDSVGEEADKPKPRSVRRRPLKPPPDHGTRRDAAKQGLGNKNMGCQDQKDEEERAIDRLLMRYSRKNAPYEVDKAKADIKPPHSQQSRADINNNPTRSRTEDGLPVRAASLPPEPMSPVENGKGHVRASSYEPDAAGPVHPKLPDYDDFVARLAAFRGK
ncbi:hypothetical protein RHGRI_024956 [Rhododendron griersonianum]|uniref:IST1-like protein n=1 Tax=Rhododendron griersonianum TaxID=479676 RepID=A0AAV6J918_9ERIC|nr:hypothetical protein RHGRI_024956 [Rhododendron griersonianum]